MSLHEHVNDCFATAVRFQDALVEIARGRWDNGRPLAAETARQIARKALTDRGRGWSDSGQSIHKADSDA